MKKLLISLFDHSGNASKPYRDSGEWDVIQVDIKHGIDILKWDYIRVIEDWESKNKPVVKIGIIAMIPCTDYATCAAKHFPKKDADGSTDKSQLLVSKTYDIIKHVEGNYGLDFWQIENPRSRIHSLNVWMGKPKLKFDPANYAGYVTDADNYKKRMSMMDLTNPSREDLLYIFKSNVYNKETWLWGQFNIPEKKHIEPLYKDNPGWRLYGGKSERTKELRSITPMGFCNAFYEFNH